MQETLRKALVLPVLRDWLHSSTHSWRTLPRPSGLPSASAPGANPDRLLLIGSGIAVGYGASSHDLALAGQLARHLSAITGRGAQVDVIVDEEMTADDVRMTLDRKWLGSVDSIVATPGGAETLMLHSARAWRRQVDALLDHVSSHAPASLHVFIVAVPPLPSIVRMPRWLGIFARWTADRINAELRLACAGRRNATFVPFRPDELAGRTGTGRTYNRWAEIIAPLVSAALEPGITQGTTPTSI